MSNLPTLYHISENMLALLESEEVTDEQIEATFGQLTEKTNHICHFLADIKGSIDAHKAEEKRIADRRKAMEAKHERLREYVKQAMTRLELDKLTAGTFTISVRPSAGKLVIDGKVPAKYKIVQVSFDAAKIKEDLQNGAKIKFAHIEPGTTLTIR